ncbi:FAD-binding domain-containing protein [Lentinus tigrinus ALCF2SS1-6]|uniref:D-lactate dehydrogenase (cytochrome) n=1 Tax=Lentinus tigrinus ALCF2SS1-6 TaxID=1328759 RepID=A0A5C2SGV3_9APHY|nr:FAD-binding domain-containing protein [Lentinus tigrinus ALCF2SS1-6]
MLVKEASQRLARRTGVAAALLGSGARRGILGGSRTPAVFAADATRARADGGRRASTTAAGEPQPQAPRSSNYALAFALGSMVSGGLAYYFASSDTTESNKTNTDFNTQYGSPEDFKKAVKELQEAFKHDEDALSTDEDELERHGLANFDMHPGTIPSVVVFPTSTEDVVKIVKIAVKYRMPVVPFSGGTSLEGHFLPPSIGGISIDMHRMDKIVEIHEADSDVVCQPGVKWMDLNDYLKKKGIPLFFPLDPGPGATLGGMLSTGCSGTNAVRYGTARAEWFLNATVVLPSGEVIKTRRRARKSSAGFDTTKLFIGAEGTLGIVTEVTIRLAPVLQTNVAVVQFPDVQKATEAVIELVNSGIGIQCVELVDDMFMKGTNMYGMSPRKWPEKDSLYLKFQGPTPRALQENAEVAKKITSKYGATGFTFARNEKEAEDLWTDRKNAVYSGLAMVPGSKAWGTDVCVPVSRLPELVYETKKDLAAHGIMSTIIGHVGDGNFHALLLYRTPEESAIAYEAGKRIVKRAIDLDGTCTGEHGVGLGKKGWLYEELGEGTIELMRTIKKAIDPLNLFNPGKLYPDQPSKK